MKEISTLWATSALKRMTLAVVFLSAVFLAQANTITIAANTNWSAITTGSGPGGQPGTGDAITITGGTLTVNVAAATCGSISFTGGTLSIPSPNVLTVSNSSLSGAV